MEQKLCKDCRWAQPATEETLWECQSPQNSRGQSLVTGERLVMFAFCNVSRMGPEGCKPEGVWWEAK